MKKIFISAVLFCFTGAQLVFAGAWTLPKGNIWIEQTGKYMASKHDYDAIHNKVRKARNARSWTAVSITKLEYGLLDWVTLLSGLEYKLGHYRELDRPTTWGNYDTSNNAFTSFEPGAKIRLLNDPVVLSAQLKGFVYIGGKKYIDPVPGSATHNSGDKPALSDGNDALELKALLGKKFNFFLPVYLGCESGYRFKNHSMCHDIPFFVEGGFWPFKDLLIKGELDGYLCHDGTGNLEKEYAIWRVGPVIRLLGMETTASITREDNFLDLSIQYGNTFWGRNTAADHEVVVKLAGQF